MRPLQSAACRKQGRSLFTAALEQTSNEPTSCDVSRLSSFVRRPACGFPVPGVRSAITSPVALPACVSTRAPRCRSPAAARLSRAHLPATLIDCPAAFRGHGDSPARRPRAAQPLRFPGRAAPVPSLSPILQRFRRAAARYVDQSSAGGDGVPASVGNGVEGRPAIQPITPVKGTYSGELESIETQELRLSTQECDFLGINIPTPINPDRWISVRRHRSLFLSC